MNVIGYSFTMFFIMALMLGVVLHNNDLDYDRQRNIYNYTDNLISWKEMNISISKNVSDMNDPELIDVGVARLMNVINKVIDVVGYYFIESFKFCIEMGYELFYDFNIEESYKLGKLLFWLIIITSLIPVIVPILALFYLIIEGTIRLFKLVKSKWKGEK